MKCIECGTLIDILYGYSGHSEVHCPFCHHRYRLDDGGGNMPLDRAQGSHDEEGIREWEKKFLDSNSDL